MAFLDILHHPPTDTQVTGHVRNGHSATQFQHIAGEGSGVGSLNLGQGNFDLADFVAASAMDAGNVQLDEDRLAADGQMLERAPKQSTAMQILRAAVRTAKVLSFLLDLENHRAPFVGRPLVMVASNPEPVVQ